MTVGSTATMPFLGLGGKPAVAPPQQTSQQQLQVQQQEEIREARRLLKERVRTDWDYPVLPAYRRLHTTTRDRDSNSTTRPRHPMEYLEDADVEAQDLERRIAGFRFHVEVGDDCASMLDTRPLEWRERDSWTESEGEDDVVNGGRSPTSSSSPGSSPSSNKSKALSVFKFEGPDSVGETIQAQRLVRKRKRQAALEEELAWNDGLRHWMARRDLWSGAKTPVELRMARRTSSTFPPQRQYEPTHSASEDRPGSSTSCDSSSASADDSTADSSPRASSSSSSSTAPPSGPSTATPASSVSSLDSQATPTLDVLLPHMSPILPTHPVRARIGPAMYHEIYTKIILASRVPSVPINLATLIPALVQGWKDDGEWPPKSAIVDDEAVNATTKWVAKAVKGRNKKSRKRGSLTGEGLKSGVKAVGRVLGLKTGTEGGAN